MNKKTVITNIIISVLLNLLYSLLLIVGGILLAVFPQIYVFVINTAFILFGLMLILTSIPNLVNGIASFKQKKAKFDLILSILTMVAGLIWAAHALISVLLQLGINFIPMPVFLVEGVLVLRWVFGILIALYLVILPIIRIVKAEKKMLQFKAELAKMIFGIVLVVLLLCGLLFSVLHNFIFIALIVAGVLTAILALLHLIVGLIGISKADKAAPAVAVALDTDGDGKAETVTIDTDGDGKVDVIGVDVDGDGKVDFVGVSVEHDENTEKNDKTEE